MFDNRMSVSNHVNAVTGNIIKTYKDSYFKRFHLKSNLSERLLEPGASEIIIQMVICGDMEVIAELMRKKDYENLFGKDTEV
jgi:hypothetical protein